jgi:hypothetical protein
MDFCSTFTKRFAAGREGPKVDDFSPLKPWRAKTAYLMAK